MRTVLPVVPFLLATTLALGAEGPIGHWSVESIDGTPVDAPQTIAFDANGGMSGDGGCNTFGGMHEMDGETISLQNIMATQRACEHSEVEGRLFDALSKVSSWRSTGGEIELLDASGIELLRLAPPR